VLLDVNPLIGVPPAGRQSSLNFKKNVSTWIIGIRTVFVSITPFCYSRSDRLGLWSFTTLPFLSYGLPWSSSSGSTSFQPGPPGMQFFFQTPWTLSPPLGLLLSVRLANPEVALSEKSVNRLSPALEVELPSSCTLARSSRGSNLSRSLGVLVG
jgi:hypothetical protein